MDNPDINSIIQNTASSVAQSGGHKMNEIVYVSKHNLTKNVSRHLHNTWELIYYTGGEGKMIFEKMELPYREGDVVIIPPNTPHHNVSPGGFTNIFLNLNDSNMNYREPFKIQDDSSHHILSAFNAAFYHYNEGINRDRLLIAYGHLLVGYINAYQKTPVHSDIVEDIRSSIVQNFSDCNFELDKYLRSLPFSYDYLRKLFKKEMGVTPHQFLCDKRLITAAECLSSSFNDSDNIADVARLCGFNEPLYFSRMFKKKYGVAPSFYRSDKQKAVIRLDESSVQIIDPDSEDE